MRKRTYYLMLAAIVAASACSRLSTPTEATPLTIPVHNFWGHGMLATSDAEIHEGQLVFICETQPRIYSTGKAEVDHYVAIEPCPSTPID